jgi:probable phosphoglycerate mutase
MRAGDPSLGEAHALAGHAGATRLLAIRHGETAWNVDARIQGHIDIALNEQGRKQASWLGRALAAGDRPDVLYSSDLARARDTAAQIAQACALPLHLEPLLRERCFGSLEGCTIDEVRQRDPELAARWRRREPDFVPPGGESLRTFYRRCVDTVQRLVQAHPGQTVAVVAHGGVLDCLYRAATGVALDQPRGWSIENASVNRMLCTDGRLTLTGWGDVSHLEAVVALDDAGDGIV